MALYSEHTHMRGPLIAKDDPPCGIESRFPRAPTTSDDRTMQSVTRWQAREGKRRNEPLPGANRLSLDMDASGRQYLRNVNTSFSRGCRRIKSISNGSRERIIYRRLCGRKLALRHWLKNKGTPLMFPVVLMKN